MKVVSGMRNREDLRVVKTKKGLYDALLQLMREKPFEEIRVLDICQLSMTNRSTFYDHFNDKYEFLDSLIHNLERKLVIKLEENKQIHSSKEYYMEMIQLFFDHISEHISTYTLILLKNHNSVLMDMIYEACLKDVREHISNDFVQDIPIEIISRFYVSGVIHICLEYVKNPKHYKKEDIIAYLDKLIPNNIY